MKRLSSYEDTTKKLCVDLIASGEIIEHPIKRLSVALAKIDLLIDDAPYSIEELVAVFDELCELLSTSFVLSGKVKDDEVEVTSFLNSRLSKIVNILILNCFLENYLQQFEEQYTSVGKSEIIGKLYNLLSCIYDGKVFQGSTVYVNDKMTCRLILAFKSLQKLTKNIEYDEQKFGKSCHQLSIPEREMRNPPQSEKWLNETKSNKNGNETKLDTAQFERITKCLFAIIGRCKLSKSILEVYQAKLFSSEEELELYVSNINVLSNAILDGKVSTGDYKQILQYFNLNQLEEERQRKASHSLNTVLPLSEKLVLRSIHNAAVSQDSKCTVIKCKDKKSEEWSKSNYKFHVRQAMEEPKWIRLFQDASAIASSSRGKHFYSAIEDSVTDMMTEAPIREVRSIEVNTSKKFKKRVFKAKLRKLCSIFKSFRNDLMTFKLIRG